MNVRIELNGKPHLVDADRRSVAHLIELLELGGRAVAVAVNRRVVPTPQWNDHLLEEADQVDVVKAIGGG
ncbi:sulfur carrier protein ThiS [Herbaspirillum sp. YR522]|uniref:sulfur carrier protein ThiS n=1 Tax=Herbaspirillum sp. YR522 TaxID=1144342 RepID=UPI00026F9A2A|nr:sulfur carrier protein ThiS [Herbaspirillum sp. YR522]EJN00917.1 thiamine biosynthesis protein ThiS [Herbaspirillum sp. YR522]